MFLRMTQFQDLKMYLWENGGLWFSSWWDPVFFGAELGGSEVAKTEGRDRGLREVNCRPGSQTAGYPVTTAVPANHCPYAPVPTPVPRHPERTPIAVSPKASASPSLLGKGRSTRGGSPPPPSVDLREGGRSRPPATYPSLPRVSCRELGSGVVPRVSDRVGVTPSIVPGASPAQRLPRSLLRASAGRPARPPRSSLGFSHAAVPQEERGGFPPGLWGEPPVFWSFVAKRNGNPPGVPVFHTVPEHTGALFPKSLAKRKSLGLNHIQSFSLEPSPPPPPQQTPCLVSTPEVSAWVDTEHKHSRFGSTWVCPQCPPSEGDRATTPAFW